MLLAGLSTGHMVGLAVVAAIFIGFALTASFLAPRRWPDFPGRQGMSVFIIACVVLFAAMITAVEVFGVESESEAQAAEGAGRTIDVTESEYRLSLPSLKTLAAGEYTFVVKNSGQIPHNLVVQGAEAGGGTSTSLIQPGQTARLSVRMSAGTYTLYCSVDSHRQQGMQAKLSVG